MRLTFIWCYLKPKYETRQRILVFFEEMLIGNGLGGTMIAVRSQREKGRPNN
jgi:hypothetical protein